MIKLLLEIAQIAHVFEVNLHIGGKDHFDEQATHFYVRESTVPVPTQNLRVCCTVKRLQDGVVVVELSKRRAQSHQECVINARVADVVPDGGNKQDKGFKRT